uniref:Uncharacterized protein n=1 Tax=Lepeophtheirus salmonis TaxID=72036 RepID=A0A0K2TXQ2_LEPSM
MKLRKVTNEGIIIHKF